MKNFVVFLVTAALVGAIGSLVLFLKNRPIPFDRQAWLAASPDQPAHDPRMVKDICEKVRGKPKSSVIDLLGKSENYVGIDKDEMYYLVRQEYRGVEPILTVHLVLKLHPDNEQVRECGILSQIKGREKRYEALQAE